MSRIARVLCEGLYFGEGPRWREGRLWFSDFFARAVKSGSPAGDVRVEFEIDDAPSGLGWMPDGKMLIVAETLAAGLTAFDIGRDGTLSGRRVWASTMPRVPDGIALDSAGAIWIANPLAPECARIAPGGAVIETVGTSQNCYACMLGGDDGKTLFMMTAPTSFPEVAAAAPKGRIETATVEAAHAGLP